MDNNPRAVLEMSILSLETQEASAFRALLLEIYFLHPVLMCGLPVTYINGCRVVFHSNTLLMTSSLSDVHP